MPPNIVKTAVKFRCHLQYKLHRTTATTTSRHHRGWCLTGPAPSARWTTPPRRRSAAPAGRTGRGPRAGCARCGRDTVMAVRDRAGVAGLHAAQQDRGGQVPGLRHRPGRRPRRRGGDARPVPPRPLGVPRLHLRERAQAGRVSGGCRVQSVGVV